MTSGHLTVADGWSRIGGWLRANAPGGAFRLPPGASEAEIGAAEKVIGRRLPDGVRESYRIHNGSNRISLFQQGFLMPLGGASETQDYSVAGLWTAMLQCAEMMKDERGAPKGPIKTDWWNLGWIPLTENECGDYICIDMVPESGGQVGQVIDWWHEQAATGVLAPSWREWLADLVTKLESGAYRFDPVGAGAIQPKQK